MKLQKITPFLWFDNQAEEAVNVYVSLFKNSKIGNITRYDAASAEVSGQKEGSIQTINFELDGMKFSALNGGSYFKFSGAISFLISCESQEEVDHFWNKLLEGGEASQCGWLTDKFGVTWQVVPAVLDELLADPDPVKASRTMKAMLSMVKLDIAELQKAHDGK